ncbi:host specificity factor TipJ family phage tail protein [Citreimonas sp.]|uniref:host specificity factor TipJ family phage tail protein n=1 Tax=Citreimonas sp. TaxID=3036715 RepID=UPI004058FA89
MFSIRMIEDPCLPGASVHQYPVGTSLAWAMEDIARAHFLDLDMVEVFDGDAHIPREAWDATKPDADAALTMKAVPGISGAVALFASFAGSWVSGLAIFAAAPLLGQIVGLAVTFAIQAIAHSLLAPETPSINNDRGPQRYSITGAQNRLIQWDAVPIVMGRMRYAPPYGAAAYTEVRGEDQYLRLLFVWGQGPVRLSDIRIGNTSIDNFDGVQIEHDLDGTGTLSLYPRDAAQQSLNINMTVDEDWVRRTTEPDTDEIGLTVTFPNGVYQVRDEGTADLRVIIDARYRLVGETTWTDFWALNQTYEVKTAKRFAKNVTVPTRGQYEVELRVQLGATPDEQAGQGFWTALRSFTNEAPVNAPGIAKTALVIKASDQLQGVVDEFNAIVEREVPVWNGTDWSSTGFTSNPAALFRDVLIGPANARAVTSANTADDNLGEWFEHCAALGLTYENVLTGGNSVAAVLSAIATAGFASPTMYDDKFGVVIDKARDTVVQAITPRNSWDFGGQINAPEELHALRVQFRNRDKDYADDELIVYAEGYTSANATRYEVVNPDGISTVAQAQLFGRFLLLSRILRAEPFQVTMDFEHLLARRGDLVAFSHDAALIGDTAGRITAVDGATLTLDEPVTFEDGGTYNVRVRTRDAEMLLLTATGTGTTQTITVNDATGINPGDLFMFGAVDGEAQLCIISDIERGEDMTANIALLPYVPALYDAIDEGVFESDLSEPVGLGLVGPAQPRVMSVLSNEAALPRSATGDVQPAILIAFEPGFAPAGNYRVTQPRNMLVSWRLTGTDPWQTMIVSALAGEARITGLEAGAAYDLRLIAQDAEFRTSSPVLVPGHVVEGFGAKPPAVASFRISQNGPQAYLEWTYPAIAADVVGYEIRYHPDQGVTDWANMARISDFVPRTARSIMAPSNTGSYAIKPVDVSGARSDDALYVSAALTEPQITNVIQTLNDAPTWAGIKSGVIVESGRLQLDDSGGSALTSLAGYYEFASGVDLGGVYSVHLDYALEIVPASYRAIMADWASLATITSLDGGVTGDEYAVEMQVRFSRDDVASGETYGDWQAFRPGEFTGRHFQFRVLLSTTDETVSPAIDALTISVDVPDRVARGEDIQSGAGAKAITFSPAFAATPSITVTGQDTASGDYHEITGKSRAGFTVTFRNNSGAAVDRKFDWQAIGYGRETGT